VATAFLAATLRFLVSAAFLAVALNFRVFAAFFAIELRKPGRAFIVAMAFLAAALRFFVRAAFLAAILNFRVRAAVFAAKLLLVGMEIPFVNGRYVAAALITLNCRAFKFSAMPSKISRRAIQRCTCESCICADSVAARPLAGRSSCPAALQLGTSSIRSAADAAALATYVPRGSSVPAFPGY
jgi:hypothetical protein